ncbi:MAG TPA: Rrf2 family transcriptional regulator [Candidatus Aquicultor sp.]|jgi:Rrf2 family protein
MRLTKKAEYATRTMLELAKHYGGRPVMAKDIAVRQDIPQKFLTQVIVELKGAGLVGTIRGTGGGTFLSVAPHRVNLRQIVEVFEGPIALNECLHSKNDCSHAGACPMYDVWRLAQAKMLSVLESTTLADLISKQDGAAVDHTTSAPRISNEIEVEV